VAFGVDRGQLAHGSHRCNRPGASRNPNPHRKSVGPPCPFPLRSVCYFLTCFSYTRLHPTTVSSQHASSDQLSAFAASSQPSPDTSWGSTSSVFLSARCCSSPRQPLHASTATRRHACETRPPTTVSVPHSHHQMPSKRAPSRHPGDTTRASLWF